MPLAPMLQHEGHASIDQLQLSLALVMILAIRIEHSLDDHPNARELYGV
jgi:hypothetical protein